MSRTPFVRRPQVAAVLALLLAGCATTDTLPSPLVRAEAAQNELAAEQLLNVTIAVFDPNLPTQSADRDEPAVFAAVRKTESTLLAFALRQTLEQTGQWGVVRVVPEPMPWSELGVTGKILASDGARLELAIRAEDASGRVWLARTYAAHAGESSYTAPGNTADPFQGLYNQIANDLLAQRRGIASNALGEIRRVAELRFAGNVAPSAFAPYLQQKQGRLRAVGLPARDNPMLERIARIRERDNLLIDSLDQHYQMFRDTAAPAYGEWRAASYREAVALQKMQGEARGRKLAGAAAILAGVIGMVSNNRGAQNVGQVAVIGGGLLVKSGIDKGRDAQIHVQALQELGSSLDGAMAPKVIELEGQTVTLNGSAEAQYREWRQLMQQLYAAQTGLSEPGPP